MWEKKALTLGEGQQTKKRAVASKALVVLLACILVLSLSACFKTNKAPTQDQTGTNNQSLGTTNSTADIDEWLVPLLSEYLADDTAACGSNTREVGAQTLTTQAQVNALSDVNKINGDLVIAPNAPALNFAPLSLLTEITGKFELVDNANQTTLAGFDCLATVGGDFEIGIFDNGFKGNPKLTSISGFSALTSVGGDFQISFNDALTAISANAFSALQTVSGYFEIYTNDALTDIPANAFTALQTVSGYFSITDNDALTDIPANAFSALQTVSGVFNISSNDALTSISAFTALQTVGSYFHIINNAALTSIAAFTALHTVDGYFLINQNAALTSIDTFSALKTVGGYFDISYNAALTSIAAFTALQTVGGNFDIVYNDALTSIEGFNSLDLSIITDTSTVSNNPMLNCQNPEPNFSSVDVSQGNLLNCTIHTSITQVVAFALQRTSSNYTPDPKYSYNSTGGAITSTRTATGKYALTFAGLTLDGKSNIQVSAEYGAVSADTYCSVHDVSEATVTIYCYDASSNELVDSRFYVAIVEETTLPSNAEITAYAIANNPAATNSYTPASNTSYSSYGKITVTNNPTSDGRYSLRFADSSVDIDANLQVSVLDSGKFCGIEYSTPGFAAVSCYDASGMRTDAKFSLTVIDAKPRTSTRTEIVGYTRYNLPTNSPSYNKSGEGVTVTAISSGKTKVKYNGLDLTKDYNVQVTTRNSVQHDHTCVLADPVITNSNEVNIACYNESGTAANTQYNVLVVKKN